jgi:very-short-patch-repair endonuclease
MSKRKTIEEFIEQAKEVHGKKYNYSKSIYKGGHQKIEIFCKSHGLFSQTPANHIAGKGCKFCANNQLITTNEFIEKAKKVHGSKYDYTKTAYKGAHSAIEIICNIHGKFNQTPHAHLNRKAGCKQCGTQSMKKIQSKTQNAFLSEAKIIHNNKYDYSKVVYNNRNRKISIICKKHGEFLQAPYHHLLGTGCPKCSGTMKHTLEEFLNMAKEVHGDKYSYKSSKYIGMEYPIKIRCTIHGYFNQRPLNHIHLKRGCPKCSKKSEGRIAEFLFKKSIVYREHAISNKFFDFYLPEYNLLIERDGEQHYRDQQINSAKLLVSEQQENDKLKTKLAKDAGFKIARIPYWLSKKEEEIEIENILAGKPTYPDVPDLKQEKTRPKPKR